MEIVLTNTKMVFNALKTKGTEPLDITDASGSDSYANIWGLNSATGLTKVLRINFVPNIGNSVDATVIYKFNKSSNTKQQITIFRPTPEQVGTIVHVDLNVDMNEGDYIAICGGFYFKTTGGNSFYTPTNGGAITDNQQILLYYNIEGY